MRIRRARQREAPALSAIALESKAHWGYSASQLATWREELTVSWEVIATLPTYVADFESAIAGFFVLRPSLPNWTLEHFWVSPSRMGRGVGRALLSQAMALVTQGGAKGLAIDADPNAEKFYVACGARRIGSLAAPIEGSPERERPQMLLEAQPFGSG